MIVYHAAWFAVSARLIDIDLHAPGWVLFQKSIAGSFFSLVGLSLHLSCTPTLRWRGYLKRLGKLLGCAAIVTVTVLPAFAHVATALSEAIDTAVSVGASLSNTIELPSVTSPT